MLGGIAYLHPHTDRPEGRARRSQLSGATGRNLELRPEKTRISGRLTAAEPPRECGGSGLWFGLNFLSAKGKFHPILFNSYFLDRIMMKTFPTRKHFIAKISPTNLTRITFSWHLYV